MRRLALVLLVGVVVIWLSGCGETRSTKTDAKKGATPEMKDKAMDSD